MEEYIKIIVYIFAGIGAGIGTGFAGLSAAAFIAPMLVAFLDFPSYDAIGIALIPTFWHPPCPQPLTPSIKTLT